MKMIPKWLPPVAACALLAFSAVAAVNARHESRMLTRELAAERQREARLEDQRRSLMLEYHTFAEFATVRAVAEKIGMLHPSAEEGTLVFLSPAGAAAPVDNGPVDNGEGESESGVGAMTNHCHRGIFHRDSGGKCPRPPAPAGRDSDGKAGRHSAEVADIFISLARNENSAMTVKEGTQGGGE